MTTDFSSRHKGFSHEVEEKVKARVHRELRNVLAENGVFEFQAVIVVMAPVDPQNFDKGTAAIWASTATDDMWTADMLQTLANDLRKKIAN